MSERGPGEGTAVVERSAEEVRAYARRKYLLFAGHLLVGAAFLTAMIAGGSDIVGREARAIAGDKALLSAVFFYFAGFSLAYLLVTLPLTFYREYVLERMFDLSTQTLPGWARRRLKKWLISFVIAAPLVLAFYWMLRRWPTHWWVPASATWVLVSYVLTKFAPQVLIPVFYKMEPIQDEQLVAALSGLAERAGIQLAAVCRIDLSRETRKANAAVVGLGSTRRVVLGDTLLEKFTRAEIQVVFAHELGHIVHRHLLKGFLWGGLIAVASLYAAGLVLGRAAALLHHQPHDPETLPVLVALVGAILFLVMPFERWYSRARELESDRYALRATGLRGPFISAMKKLGRMNLADVKPGKLAEIFLFSHPPISRRIRLAETIDLGPAE